MSEKLHPRADELDGLSALEFVQVMHAEDAAAVAAMKARLPAIALAVEQVADRLKSGGRLHYFGVGSSGLIAQLDAYECPVTFGVATDVVQAHTALDPQEDDRDLGRSAARAAAVSPADAAVGLSASGGSAFVLGALEHAASVGALTVAITSHEGTDASALAEIAIEVVSGPEVIAGSTRLKAGTVQKLVLNMLSTAVFTRLGHTYRGRMVGVVASNEKLRARAARIVADLSGVSLDEARRRLDDAGGDVRVALGEARRA